MTDSDASRGTAEVQGETTARTNPKEDGKGISAAVALLGLWLLVEPVLFDVPVNALWNDVIVGLALIALGGYNYYRRSDERFGSTTVGIFVALLGLWLLVTPLVLNPTPGTGGAALAFWNDVVVGALVVIFGVYSATEARQSDVSRQQRQT